MNFSLSWFTSVSGILITLGVVLLVIALIILIVGKRKDKGETNDIADANVNLGVPSTGVVPVYGEQVPPSIPTQVIDVTTQPISQTPVVMEPQPVAAPIGVQPDSNVQQVPLINTEPVGPQVENVVQPVVVPPQEGPVDASQVSNQVAAPLNVVNPVAAPVDASAQMQPVQAAQVISTPQPAPVVTQQQPVVQPMPVSPASSVQSLGQTQVMPVVNPNQQPTIYGGADPSANVQVQTAVQPTQVYGGVNPVQTIQQ